jgi:hypothetical protein
MLFPDASSWTDAVFQPGISDSMSYYVYFPSSNLRIVVLDQYYDTASCVTWLAGVLDYAKEHGLAVATFEHTPTAKITAATNCTFMTLDDESAIWGASPFESTIASFVSGGGEFVANFCGHWHRNYFGKTANGVLNIVIPAATIYADFNDSARKANTRTLDCFDVVGIDTNLKLIKLIRIGNNADHYLRPQNAITYNYQTDQIITNY